LIEYHTGYIPGVIGRISELHGIYYHQHWGFGVFFEARVATDLSEFLKNYIQARDRLWTISQAGRIEGSIAIDGSRADTEGAHLRWFIVAEALQRKGYGSQLITLALDFCHAKGYSHLFLNTFEGLETARHLYEKNGFQLVEQRTGAQWGLEVNEQRYELTRLE